MKTPQTKQVNQQKKKKKMVKKRKGRSKSIIVVDLTSNWEKKQDLYWVKRIRDEEGKGFPQISSSARQILSESEKREEMGNEAEQEI